MNNAKALSTKSVVTDSYRFIVCNIISLAILFVPIFLFLSAVGNATVASGGYYFLISVFFSFGSYPIIVGVLIQYVAQRWFQKSVDYHEIFIESLRIWWPVFQVLLFTCAAGLLGFFLLIVPGIWIATRLSFSLCYAVIVRLDPNTSVRQSFAVTKKTFWIILKSAAVFLIPLFFIEIVLQSSIDAHGMNGIFNIGLSTASSFFQLISYVVVFRVFMVTVLLESNNNKEN